MLSIVNRTSGPTVIRIRDLEKTFWVHRKAPGLKGSIRSLFRREKTPKHALRSVSFDVDEGEIVGLIGANGAGKTTLVKILAGIIHPGNGEARVLGFDPWQRDNSFRQRIALIMGQKAQLWWDLPAADCFLLLKEIYQIESAVYDRRLDELTEMLGVRDEINIQIRRLSLGERMKMELVAALLHAPKVVFLDEPTIGLDLTAQRAIREFLLAYREEHQPAMILTSHYMEDIEHLCRRIVILREGRVVYDGALLDVLNRYASNKRVTAHLKSTAPGVTPRPIPSALSAHVDVERYDDQVLTVSVPREDAASTVALLLEYFDVEDLTIESEDIGSIVERIIRHRSDADSE